MDIKTIEEFAQSNGEAWEALLDTWVSSENGQAWNKKINAGLLNKNSELLGEVVQGKAKMKTVNERIQTLESDLEAERAFISRLMIDKEIESNFGIYLLDKYALPHHIEMIKNAFGITVVPDGEGRKVCGKAPTELIESMHHNSEYYKEKCEGRDDLSLSEILEIWKQQPETRRSIKSLDTGGGAPGSSRVPSSPKPNISSMSGQALAKMTDSEFANLRSETIRRNNN